MNDREHVDTGWRARRRARIERVAAGGPLWARRRPSAAQLRRRRLTAVGCCLALVLGLAVAVELGNEDGADSGPRTALRPEAAPPGEIVSDDGTADEEFAEGGPGDGALADRRGREGRRKGRDGRRARSGSRSSGASGGSVRRRVAGVPLPAQTAPAPVAPSPPPTAAPPTRRVTRRVAPERRPARRRSRAPAPAPPAPPVLAAPPPVPARAPVDGRGHHDHEGHGHHHHHGHHDHDDEDEDDDH